jgi:hypothetical protein
VTIQVTKKTVINKLKHEKKKDLQISLGSFGCVIFLKNIQNCECQENLFFEIMFGRFRKPDTKLKKSWIKS